MGKWVEDFWYVVSGIHGWIETFEQAYDVIKEQLGDDCPSPEQVKDELFREEAFERDGVFLYQLGSEHYVEDEEDE